jgi:malic enzyme
MKTHGEFVRWLKNKYPDLLIEWEKALTEFYLEDVKE